MNQRDTQLVTAYGFDPALRHGCLLRATFEFKFGFWDVEKFGGLPDLHDVLPVEVTLKDWKVVFEWTAKSEFSIKKGSDAQAMGMLSDQVLRAIHEDYKNQEFKDFPRKSHFSHYLPIDFDPNAVYWRGQKIQVVRLSYLMGYLVSSLSWTVPSLEVLMVSPKKVREQLGLRGNSAKEEVIEVFQRLLANTEADFTRLTTRKQDRMDALILSFTSARALAIVLQHKHIQKVINGQ